MNDKIDVLAVMDAAIYERGVSAAKIAEARGMAPASQIDECDRRLSLLSDARTDDARKLHEARAAIAELIEATPSLLAIYRIKWGNLDPDANAVLATFERAFSRVGGAK